MTTKLAVPSTAQPAEADGSRTRFHQPTTPVSERIKQLTLDERSPPDVLAEREEQRRWLIATLARHWDTSLPQPYIGFDHADGTFTASWVSETEHNTLTIDARTRTGWYDPYPAAETDNPIPDEIDLDAEEAWQKLRHAVTATRV